MNISSGIFKGLKLDTPEGDITRPTAIKVRQAVFNILQGKLTGVSFLDLFAGSGSMGIEALSRGATKAVFVEKNKLPLNNLKSNLIKVEQRIASLNINAPEITVFGGGVEKFLENSVGKHDLFDMVWADPPYADIKIKWAKAFKDKLSILIKEKGLLIMESNLEGYESLVEIFTSSAFVLQKYAKYGYSHISIWEKI